MIQTEIMRDTGLQTNRAYGPELMAWQSACDVCRKFIYGPASGTADGASGRARRRSQSTPPGGRGMNDRNLQFLTIDYCQPGIRRLCLAFSVDDRTGYGPRPDDRTNA